MRYKKICVITSMIIALMSVTTAYIVDRAVPEVVQAAIYTWGSKGASVRQIQTRLRDWGFYKGSVDGSYGYQTWDAVRRFQQRHGLKADGITGRTTLEKLGLPTGAAQAAGGGGGVVATQTKYTWGSKGEGVKEIQRRLRDWGYLKGAIDGSYGYQTWSAVKRFQSRHGLTADGVAGRGTLEKLGIPVRTAAANTDAARNLHVLAAAIHGEARGEPYLGQVAVGAVVMNRARHPSFPNTIAGVVYQPGAFDAVKDGQINLTPGESSRKAARDALNGWDPTDGSIYYWNPATATSRWIWSVPITKQIGRHVFGKK